MRVLLSLLLASLGALPALPANGAPVLVYYSSVVPARERQDALRSELRKLDGSASLLEFTVFGRFRDFIDQLDSSPPPVVVAPSFFSKFHPEYLPVLGLKKGDSRQFRYRVLSLGGDWNAGNLSSGRIGMVDEVGRDKLGRIIPEILSTRIDRIKSVSKSEDLFPLLAFKSVDFVLISIEEQQALQEKFRMPLRNVMESRLVDRPVIFVRRGVSTGDAVKTLRELPGSTWAAIGFTGVESIGEERR